MSCRLGKFQKIAFLFYTYGCKNGWASPLINDTRMCFFKYHSNGAKLSDIYHTIRFLLTRKPAMPQIEYVVSTHCNLRCKHCNTFVPYFSSKQHVSMVSFEQFKQDVDILLASVDYILHFGFVGGELLLCKDLPKMLDYAKSQNQIRNVFVATNCTIMPSEELLAAMHHKKFAMQISDYSSVKNMPHNVKSYYEEFKALLLRENICFSAPHDAFDAKSLRSKPELYIDTMPLPTVTNLFNGCWGRQCNMLHGGLLTQCTVSVYISRAMELTPGVRDEIVDIRAAKTSHQLTRELIRFYCRPYSQFCHYCHWENMQSGLPCGEQLETLVGSAPAAGA